MSDPQLVTTRDEVSVAAERLLVLVEKPSIPGSGVTAPGQLQREGRAARWTTFRHPEAGYGSRLARGIVRAPGNTWSFIFSALRGAYWLLDPDAKCRSVGLQTVGRVDKTQTHEHTDPETGGVSYTHHVTYRFDSDGETHSTQKKVGSLGNLKNGSPIRVYYLPDTDRPNSAIDWEPRTLA